MERERDTTRAVMARALREIDGALERAGRDRFWLRADRAKPLRVAEVIDLAAYRAARRS